MGSGVLAVLASGRREGDENGEMCVCMVDTDGGRLSLLL